MSHLNLSITHIIGTISFRVTSLQILVNLTARLKGRYSNEYKFKVSKAFKRNVYRYRVMSCTTCKTILFWIKRRKSFLEFYHRRPQNVYTLLFNQIFWRFCNISFNVTASFKYERTLFWFKCIIFLRVHIITFNIFKIRFLHTFCLYLHKVHMIHTFVKNCIQLWLLYALCVIKSVSLFFFFYCGNPVWRLNK